MVGDRSFWMNLGEFVWLKYHILPIAPNQKASLNGSQRSQRSQPGSPRIGLVLLFAAMVVALGVWLGQSVKWLDWNGLKWHAWDTCVITFHSEMSWKCMRTTLALWIEICRQSMTRNMLGAQNQHQLLVIWVGSRYIKLTLWGDSRHPSAVSETLGLVGGFFGITSGYLTSHNIAMV